MGAEKQTLFFFFSWSLETSRWRIPGQGVKNTGCGLKKVLFLCFTLKYSAAETRMDRVLWISRRQMQGSASAVVTVKVPSTQGEHVPRGSWSGWHKLAFQIRRVQWFIPRAKLAKAWIWWMHIGHVGQYLAAKGPPGQMVKARPQLSFWSGSKS